MAQVDAPPLVAELVQPGEEREEGARTAEVKACVSRRWRVAGASLARRWRPSNPLLADAASLFAWFCCGVSYVVTKQSFVDASPFVFQTLRFAAGAITVACLYGSPGLRFRQHAKGVLIVGTLLNSGYMFQSAALRLTSPSRTAFLTALCVPMTPLFETFITRTPPTAQTLLSAAVVRSLCVVR